MTMIPSKFSHFFLAIIFSLLFCINAVDATDTTTVITSNVIATDSVRGTVARNMARDFSEGSTKVEQTLYDNFMLIRAEIEVMLKTNGFAERDVGVAYGVYFVTLWELANGVKLPQDQEKKAVQYWTQHLHELNINDAKLGDKKDLFYDFLLHTPIILVALQEAAKQINNKELLAVIPESAAELFMFLTKYPAAIVDIQSDGSMLADKAKSNDFLLNAPAEEVRRFLETDMSQSKIDAFLAKRQTPKKTKRSTKSGKNVDRHVQDTYRSMIQTNTLMMFPNSWL